VGIVEQELGTAELSNEQSVIVEYNQGDVIHLHVGNLRLDFSPDEFLTFAQVILEGRRNLVDIKNGIHG
jgi:hypothetical protein